MTHGIEQFIDKTMLSFVILFAIIYAATFRNKAAFYKNFGDGALRAGWIFGMMSLIVATNSPFFGELYMVKVGMAFATSVLYVLYGFILDFSLIIRLIIFRLYRFIRVSSNNWL